MRSRKLRVLIVEDDAETRSTMADLLTAEGFVADQAADGAQALERLVEHAPDVIVSDLNMPGMDGMRLLEELRARSSEVPVIVVTSMSEVGAAVTAMRAGAADYLTTPLDFDALELAIAR